MRFFKKTNFDFISQRKKWYIVSLIITLAGLVGAFTKGVEFGIDFAGGTELQLDFQKNVEIEQIRGALEQGGFRGAEVKYYGADESGVLVRVREGATGTEAESAAVTEKVLQTISTNIQGNSAEMLQQQHIGPKIGAE
ncbi:MAG TPA: protein translocase subunit SecF, partial [Candidatus Kapabacteria bacterium]|nr:protein translocase subunit SecF [Candidatus Kapabacteria bacterium]